MAISDENCIAPSSEDSTGEAPKEYNPTMRPYSNLSELDQIGIKSAWNLLPEGTVVATYRIDDILGRGDIDTELLGYRVVAGRKTFADFRPAMENISIHVIDPNTGERNEAKTGGYSSGYEFSWQGIDYRIGQF